MRRFGQQVFQIDARKGAKTKKVLLSESEHPREESLKFGFRPS